VIEILVISLVFRRRSNQRNGRRQP
jgi:hypothetical protein